MEQSGLTEEQRARAERNKQAALAKKQRKREQQSTAASAEAEDAEPARRTRSEYAKSCALFGTQASQRSQDDAWTQPSQAPFVDVTNQPTRAETQERDDDDDAVPVHDGRDAALVRDDREAPPRDDREAVPARDDDSDDAAPVRIDDVKDDEEAADILVASASDMITYGDARRALALIQAAADAGPRPSINALPVLYHIAGKVTPERLLEICKTRAAAIVSLQRTCHSDEDQLTERFNELLAAPEPDEDENASEAPDDADADDADAAAAFFGAFDVDPATLLSQRPHDAQSLSQYAYQDGLDLGEVRLTGFETSEAAAGQLEAVLAIQRKLAAAAAAKDEERRRHQAPVPAMH